MRITNRCKTHNIFTGKGKCKQCIKDDELLKEKDEQIKKACDSLTKTEETVAINILAAESTIASIWDLIVNAPESRKKALGPLLDSLFDTMDKLHIINTYVAESLKKNIGEAQYNKQVIETILLLDKAAGKIERCNTCSHNQQHRMKIKKEIKG